MSSGPEIVKAMSSVALDAEGAQEREDHAYRRILRSSAIIGMSSVANIGIGIVRTKVLAMLLGPAGFGLMALYNSIIDVAISIAGLGVNNSGVRQIAEAASTKQREKIARTATILRRTSILLGIGGAATLAVLSSQVSNVTFGNDGHAAAIVLVSLAILLRIVASGQTALLQGLRRISDIARVNIVGALSGSLASVILVLMLGESGIAPSIVAVAALTLVTSWWLVRKVEIDSVKVSAAEARTETAALIKLGFAFMASGMLTVGAAYVVRLIVVREIGLDAAGLYSSAWTLGGLYVGYVLQAMGADFYPDLVGVANDDARATQLVNDQALVSMLLAGPGIIATITFTPLVIALFYTANFMGAVDVLRWICLGMALRVVTWPMGYIIVAKNRQLLFLGSDFAWTIVNIALTWFCVAKFGLAGAGMAFFGSYVFHALMTYPIVRWIAGFRWTPANRKTGSIFLLSIALAFGAPSLLPNAIAIGVGALLTIVSSFYSLRLLLLLVASRRLPDQIRRLFMLFRLVPGSG